MSGFNSQTGREWGRIGGTIRTSRHDPKELAKTGQRGLLARFEREIDPEGILDPAERMKRAVRMRKAHMRRLVLLKKQKLARAAAAAAAAGAHTDGAA